MNREQRRRAERRAQGVRAVAAIAEGYACPDCTATKELREQAPAVFALVIAHDDTCPWLADRAAVTQPKGGKHREP